MLFSLTLPEVIRFGRGVRFQLPGLLPQGRILFVSGRHGEAEIIRDMFPLLGSDRCTVFTIPAGEPELSTLDEILDLTRKIHFSAIVGWGGGSAMDLAKAVAALFGEDAPAAEYFYGRRQAKNRSIFLAEIPTTAGTGAEITANAVLTDSATGIKQSLRTGNMAADAALVDPELVQSCPRHIMASSGFDALTQAVESFTSLKADTLTRSIAQTAVRDILLALEDACRGRNEAVDAVTRGCMNTAIAFSRSGLGAVHGIAHPLGSLLKIPHGICCAVLLPEILKYNTARVPELYAALAAATGFPTAEQLISAIEKCQRALDIPENFKNWHLGKEHYSFIIANCRSGSMKCNPVHLTDDDVAGILERLS